MRYPLLAFLFVFVIPPFTAHALLVGKAEVVADKGAAFTVASVAVADETRIFNWTVPATRDAR